MSEELQGRKPFGQGQCGVNFNMPKRLMDGERSKKRENIVEVK